MTYLQDVYTSVTIVITTFQLISIIKVFVKNKMPPIKTLECFAPIGLIAAYFYASFTFSTYVWQAPVLVILNSGFYYCLMVTKLIITNVTSQQYTHLKDIHQSVPMILQLLAFPIIAQIKTGKSVGEQEHIDKTMFVVSLAMNIGIYLLYVANLIRQICNYLDIYCFTIKKKGARMEGQLNYKVQ